LRNGQYDDTYSPSVRMLFDDKPVKSKENLPPVTTDQTVKKGKTIL
jgi:nitrogen fixation-related uncharacterized protein